MDLILLSRIGSILLAALFGYVTFKLFVLGEFTPTKEKVKRICKIILIAGFPAFILTLILTILTQAFVWVGIGVLLFLILAVAISGYFDVIFLSLPMRVGKLRVDIPIPRKPGRARGIKFWFYLIVWLIVNGSLWVSIIMFFFR